VVRGAVAAVLVVLAPLVGAEDEPTKEEVSKKALDVSRSLRGAEEALVRGLRSSGTSGGRATAADAAAVSIAKLLEATRDDSRRAAAAMQWLVDNAPQ